MAALPTRFLVGLVAVMSLVLVGCDDGDGGPGQGTVEVGPRGPDDIVQHLIDPPAYPAPVTDDAELVELRNPEGNNRHQAYMAELGESGALDGALVRGSMILVTEGTELRVPDGASTAVLEVGTVVSVGDCPAPCEVSGPALVAPSGWLAGIGLATGWELIVPAPDA